MSSIPASQIVSVTPSVVSAGGSELAFNGLILSTYAGLPTGTPVSFSTASDVSDYFGPASVEAAMASFYFNGFDNSTVKPGSVLFSRYSDADVAAFERGAAFDLTVAELQAVPSTQIMTMEIDGTVATCTGVDFSGITSFSDAATLIGAAFTGVTPTVTYDSTFDAFVITSPTVGETSTVDYASGNLAETLKLSSTDGAVLSQGMDAETPDTHMDAVIEETQNWVSFTTTWEPNLANKEAFAAWNTLQGTRYVYVAWDSDANAVATPGDGNISFGQYLAANSENGTAPYYIGASTTGYEYAASLLGSIASIDFTETNGRATMAFKSCSGLSATITNATQATNALANGYNFYGAYGTANDTFTWLYNGQISGDLGYIDSYVNAVWLNNQIQLALMDLFANMKSIPYTQAGYNLIRAAVQDPITAAVNFGAIRAGVPLSASQKAQVNAAAGTTIDQTLATRGWYFQVLPATAQVRAARQSPPCKLWYMDGQSVQQLNINSIAVL